MRRLKLRPATYLLPSIFMDRTRPTHKVLGEDGHSALFVWNLALSDIRSGVYTTSRAHTVSFRSLRRETVSTASWQRVYQPFPPCMSEFVTSLELRVP